MSTKLVLLALLQEKPLHGYELKHIIEEHMGDWTNIAFGSIYFALNKLNEEGFVEKSGEERIGNRPSRYTYKITEKGRKEFIYLLREIWQKYERDYYSIDIALAFSNSLSKDEVTGYLKNRISNIENILKHLKVHKIEQTSRVDVPKSAKAVFSHSEYHFKAELNWLKETLMEFEKGNLP